MAKKLLIFLLAISLQATAQDYRSQSRQLFFYNTAFGGMVAGIGSAIHKHAKESTFHAFTNGFWKGCIGGSVNYLGKNLTGLMREDIRYGWGATLVHATGSSIIRNASRNENIFSDWQIEIAFGSFSVRDGLQLHPASTAMFIYSSFHGDFDFKTSASTGKMYFKSQEGECITRVNSITVNRKFTEAYPQREQEIVIHEFIHTLQEEEYCVINEWLPKKYVPWWIYLDIPFADVAYHTSNAIAPPRVYNSNLFEFEANHFSTRHYLIR